MKPRFFELAEKASNSGEHHQHKIGAVLIKKNRVISFGFNRQKTHPASPSPFKYLHAEVDCVLGIDPKDIEDSELYVFRKTRNNTLAMSKPCKHCEWLLKILKVHKVHYTSDEGYKTLVFNN